MNVANVGCCSLSPTNGPSLNPYCHEGLLGWQPKARTTATPKRTHAGPLTPHRWGELAHINPELIRGISLIGPNFRFRRNRNSLQRPGPLLGAVQGGINPHPLT